MNGWNTTIQRMFIHEASPAEVVDRIMPFVDYRYKDNKGLEFVYILRSCRHGIVKVGVSKRIKHRFLALRGDGDFEMVTLLRGNRHIEYLLHMAFSTELDHGREWFHCSPRIMEIISLLQSKMDRRHKNIMKHLNNLYPSQIRNVGDGVVLISIESVIKSIRKMERATGLEPAIL